ncbi:MAG: tRNA (N6-isopentenyl adenosine(37)-C2)-methylthiotransferase MiaB [Candidatus Aureabacteria bacterium]|nr:tRNA (N6-isopentenyl adenosine(37)-C2)-methylthiotransferase MiaB [Candidatus Auribacterota bacterium]
MSPICVITFGCQMNEYDSEVMAGLCAEAGWTITDDEEKAGVILINTCSVRRHAEERVWGRLFALKERASREPDLIIGVCGCMAQGKASEIARRCPHVRLICGTRAFDRLPSLIERARRERGGVIDVGEGSLPRLASPPRKRESWLKAFVPVMRGCNNRCAYCVVPALRGPEVSRSGEEIIAEIRLLASDGCREITLLGQNVNSYRAARRDGMQATFAGLLGEIASISGIERIRFMTSHPKDMPDELIAALAGLPKVCPHLHLPLQSGSDRILEGMKRGYTFGAYRLLVRKIRDRVPGIALTTDLIAGFPGETEEDFKRTLGALEEISFDGAFIFKYSDSEGTAAAGFIPKVPDEEIARRHGILLKRQGEIGLAKNSALVGQAEEVLVEGPSPRNPGRLFGRTRANRRVVFEGGERLIGTAVCVTIRAATPLTLLGEFRG